MHVYYQMSDNKSETWHHADDNQPGWDKPAKHVSVYSYSEKHHADLDYDQVLFKGDLVFDLDDGDNLDHAIRAANLLLDHLKDKGVDLSMLQVDASGKKGLHVVIPQALMGPTHPLQHLNRYHSFIAGALAAQAGVMERIIDKGPYKRRAFIRVRNKMRDDGNGYKVPLTIAEVRSLTPATYRQLCSTPRLGVNPTPVPENYRIKFLEALWDRAKHVVAEDLRRAAKIEPVPLEALQGFNADNLPKCMVWHRDAINVKSSSVSNFNRLAMNVAGFLVGASFPAEDRKKFLETMADAYPSKKESRADRIAELESQVRYAAHGTTRFACQYARPIHNQSPCAGCSVARIVDEETNGACIEEEEDGFYFRSGKLRKRMTNFVMHEQEIVKIAEGGEWRLIGKKYSLKPSGGTFFLPASAFNSVAEFKREVCRQAGLHFLFLTDEALAVLSMHLDRHEAAEVHYVDKFGINIVRDGDSVMPVWVERDWDIDADGGVGGYKCPEQGMYLARMRGRDIVRPKRDVIKEVLEHLFLANRPDVSATVFGWAMACHLKEHLVQPGIARTAFPLLHLAGQQGAGKTKTATRAAALTGADYSNGDPPLAPTLTSWPLRRFGALTNTVARVLDEVNPSRMDVNHWKRIVENLKGGYDRQMTQIGTLGRDHQAAQVGARTISMTTTSPIIYLGWDVQESQDLNQRSLRVVLSEHDHRLEGRDRHYKAVVRAGWDPLWDFCRLSIDTALHLEMEELKDEVFALEDEMSEWIQDRPMENLLIVRIGWWFFCKVVARHKMNSMSALARDLEEGLVKKWKLDFAPGKARRWGQLEDMLAKLGELSYLPQDGALRGFMPGAHFIRDGDKLWFNLPQMWMHYKYVCKATGEMPVVPNWQQFLEGVQRENYYVAHGPHPNAPENGDCLCISVSAARARGINLAGFKEWG